MKLSDVVDFLDNPSAFEIRYKGSKVQYLNEAGTISDSSRFFVAGFEFGAHVLVHVESYRGEGFEAAYEAWIDSLPEIEKDEYVEAYGTDDGSFLDIAYAEIRARHETPVYTVADTEERFKGARDRARELLNQAVEKAQNEDGEYPEIVEGYREDSSGKVKSLGHYEWMNEADLDDIEIVRKEEKEPIRLDFVNNRGE